MYSAIMNKKLFNFRIICLGFVPAALILSLFFGAGRASASSVTVAGGYYSSSRLQDHSYYTNLELSAGTIIRVDDAACVRALYIEWDFGTNPSGSSTSGASWFSGKPGVKEWILRIDGVEYTFGKNGYLHEYVELPVQGSVLELVIPDGGASLCGFYCIETDELPDWVQLWEQPNDEADLLILSAHSDDEVLFLGGTLPYYAGELGLNVQMVYFTYHTQKCRMHESLNALYYCGVRNYPIWGNHEDLYSTSLSHAKTLYNNEETVEFVVGLLRRFKPNVVLTHDLNGEYGHGVHMLCANLMTQAYSLASDPSACPVSYEAYGVWQVKKLYLHFYDQNKIDMEWNQVMANYGGITAWEAAGVAFKYYDSQLIYYGNSLTRRESSDYDCTRFGLYATSVGPDILKNDFFENIPENAYKNYVEPLSPSLLASFTVHKDALPAFRSAANYGISALSRYASELYVTK